MPHHLIRALISLVVAGVPTAPTWGYQAGSESPDRAIVFIIDGLHWRSPDKLDLPNLMSLIGKGVYCQKSCMIVPHHPTVGEYGRVHTSSFPNPVLQSGTLFVRPSNRYLQEVFPPDRLTAFIANTPAYRSVSRGFDYLTLDHTLSDQQVVDLSIKLIKDRDPAYIRIHLQTPGNEGRYLSYTDPSKPYFRNIWGIGSPYVAAIKEADRLLGQLIHSLQEQNKWRSTLLIVTSDQGQSEIGWHPVADEDSWLTPLIMAGPGLPQGVVVPYLEHTDLAPTVASLMNVDPPNQGAGGAGQPLLVDRGQGSQVRAEIKPFLATINRQVNEYERLRAELVLASTTNVYYSSYLTFIENELLTTEPFFGLDRFTEWWKAGSVDHLIEVNDKILGDMKRELSGVSRDLGAKETLEE